MDKWRGKVAIVTGANSGIGAAIASTLVREGVVVVGLDRFEDQIKSLAKELSNAEGKLYSVKADVKIEDDILAAFNWVERELGGADILVNNAGVASIDLIADGKTEEWRDMVSINILGVAICSREYLKSMEKRKNNTGHIINLSSLTGHLPIPYLGMYSATKHAVRAISMCLRKELADKKSNIKVTTVCPGEVATSIFNDTIMESMIKSKTILEAKDVANVVVNSLSATNVTQVCEVVVTPMNSDFVV